MLQPRASGDSPAIGSTIGSNRGKPMFGFARRKEDSGPPRGIDLAVGRTVTVEVPTLAPELAQRVDAAIQAASEFTLTATANEAEVIKVLDRIRRGHDQGPVTWELRTGIVGFLNSVFPGGQGLPLYGQVFVREPRGRGAHFDIYDDHLHADFPWVALFNLAGDAVVSVCRLPESLAERYALAYPEPSVAASAERRRLADEAFAAGPVQPEKGMLLAGSGLIIPQQSYGPEWVHNVVPLHAQNPGRFIKLIVGREGSARHLERQGYSPVDALIAHALLNSPTKVARQYDFD